MSGRKRERWSKGRRPGSKPIGAGAISFLKDSEGSLHSLPWIERGQHPLVKLRSRCIFGAKVRSTSSTPWPAGLWARFHE